MIQTILIVLVAVVVLIVIIAVLALRYLRADDSDTFDDIPDEPRPARQRPNLEDGRRAPAPARRPRQQGARPDGWATERPARAPDSRGQAGYRNRETGPRPAIQDRASGPRRQPGGARPARPPRPDNLDAETSSWDSLSDVDYWTELAADKPPVSAAPGPSPAARRSSDPGPESRPQPAVRASRRSQAAQLPTRSRQQSSLRAGPASPRATGPRAADLGQTEQIDLWAGQQAARQGRDAAVQRPDALPRRGSLTPSPPQRADSVAAGPRSSGAQRAPAAQRATGPRPAQPAQSSGPLPAFPAASSNGHARSSRRSDDDPLTSPSFPAVNTSDSRSYRAQRSAASRAGASGQHAQPATDAMPVSGHQLIEYSSAPPRTSSAPRSYPAQPASTPRDVRQPAVPAAAANPYGSYVSQPQPIAAEPGYQPAGYPDSAPSFAAAGYSGYPSGTHAGQPDGFLPSGGLTGTGNGTGNGTGGRHRSRHSAPPGYASIDYSGAGYGDSMHPDDQAQLAGYGPSGQHAAQYDQMSYGSTDNGYAPDGYQDYSGYGASSF